MGKIVMGYWDCPVCGQRGIAGNVMNCPACGRARGDVKFYMKGVSENESREAGETGDIEYLSKEQEQDFGNNPDWYCSFCNSLNRDNAAFCQNCGASRESSESNYFDQLKKRQEKEAAEKAAQPQLSAAGQARKKSRLPLLLILAVVLVAAFIISSHWNTTRSGLEVTDILWARSIPVEQYQEFQEDGWTIPQGGTEISSAEKLHHYDQVLDHYEDVEVQRSRQVLDHYETYYTYTDRGNGSFEQVEHQRPVYKTEYYTETESRPVYVSVPRYATWYTYSIWRWTQVRTEVASGSDHEAYWPEIKLGENEREGSPREAQYSFYVKDEKENRTWWRIEDEKVWRSIQVGDLLTMKTSRSEGSRIVDGNGNTVAKVFQIQ